MSLRKPPELTPELLAAKWRNAQLSTGPRTEAGKQNSKFNALKHGEYAAPQNHRLVMLALGEDPEEFEFLKKELMLSYGPGEILWEKQIDDLARLYWRRQRLERAQEGMMRRALLAAEERQHRRRQEIAAATFDASQADMLELPWSESADPGVQLRRLLSFLEVIREQVKQHIFAGRQEALLEASYQGRIGWRQARLCKLLRLFSESAQAGARPRDEHSEESPREKSGPDEPAGEAEHQELLRRLEEEIASVQEEFQYAEKVNEEKAAIERDACLAPVGEEWQMLLRREATLDRSIDRKVRILLAMRKEFLKPKPLRDLTEVGEEEEKEYIAEILGRDIPTEDSASQGEQGSVLPNQVQAAHADHPLDSSP